MATKKTAIVAATNAAKINEDLAKVFNEKGKIAGSTAAAQLEAGIAFGLAVKDKKETNVSIEDAPKYSEVFYAAKVKAMALPSVNAGSVKTFASQLAGFARESVAATNEPYAHLEAVKLATPALAKRSIFQMATSVNAAIEKAHKETGKVPSVTKDFTSAVFAESKPKAQAKEKTPQEQMDAMLKEIADMAKAVLALKGVKRAAALKATLAAAATLG